MSEEAFISAVRELVDELNRHAASGLITGYMSSNRGPSTLANAGVWNLRNFADTNGDLVRDALSVAVADFGVSGANTIDNTGTIALLGRGGGTALTLNTTGQYLPLGYAFNQMTLSSPVQGQILGVQTFNHSGVIDLTANWENGNPLTPVVGDVLVISGGHTAGTDGGGVFVSNGGTLKLNTVLNEGGANSQSDILVLDSTRLGTGATGIAVTNVNGGGALTTGDGIALVEVLNKSVSDGRAFVLSGRAAAGAYEYTLFHGGDAANGGNPNDGNWYLRSTVVTPDNPVVPNVRPEVAVNMVIPPLAIEYGYAMIDTLHERVGETYPSTLGPVYEDREVWCKNPDKNFRCTARVPVTPGQSADSQQWFAGAWGRLIGEYGRRDRDNFLAHGSDYDYTIGGIQAGLDLWGREKDGNLDKAGLYVGYGRISSDVNGLFDLKAGSVDMDGYTLGGYWTHHAASGWYTDAVLQGTIYDSDAKSIYGEKVSPNGWGIAASLEGGYAFKFGDGWTVEPQAQLAYQRVSIDRDRDSFGIFAYDDWDSLRGRLGARVTKTWNAGDEKTPRLITGWVRANVWHEFLGDDDMIVTSLLGQNPVRFSSSLKGTWAELGAGVSGQVSDSMTLFGTVAYNRSFDDKGRDGWDGRVGLTVKW